MLQQKKFFKIILYFIELMVLDAVHFSAASSCLDFIALELSIDIE